MFSRWVENTRLIISPKKYLFLILILNLFKMVTDRLFWDFSYYYFETLCLKVEVVYSLFF